MKKTFALASIILVLSAPLVFALGEPCQGDFDFDGDVDATDVTTFLHHLGRNPYNDPCPPSGFAMVPKTGQTTSYGRGDDGDLEKGVAWPIPRFTDNGNGTVTDRLTGLVWLKNANCFGPRTWVEALSDCNGLATGACGLTDGSRTGDWRLPNVEELHSLTDFGRDLPALPSGHPFAGVQAGLESSYYWTSTTYRSHSGGAWVVRMFDGYLNGHYKTGSYFVWPVRDSQ